MSRDCIELIKSRRSIRKFEKKEVPDELVMEVLEAGIWAPSGLNNQPWRFVVVKGEEVKSKLAELTKYSHIVKGASVLIVVLLERSKMYHQIKDHQSAGACIQNILLSAWALGIGSCWLGEILKNEERVKECLGLESDGYELCAVIALGYPADDSPRKGRNPLESFILKKL